MMTLMRMSLSLSFELHNFLPLDLVPHQVNSATNE